MYIKKILLITFVLLLSLTNAAWAIPFDEADAVWNLHGDDPRADENGPPFTTLGTTYYAYYAEVEEVTGGESGEKWDGWAAPSAVTWWSVMYYETSYEIRPVGAVTFFVRVRLGDLSPEQNVITGMYDGACEYSNYPSYGIEIHSGEPVYVVTEAGMQGIERTECHLGKTIEANTWYDMAGQFDPFNNVMTLTVAETRGPPVGEASIPVDFDELWYSDLVEWEIFCSPCWEMGSGEGDGHIELIAVWIGAIDVIVEEVQVSDPTPDDKEEGVRCDVEEVCFYPPSNAQIMDPCDPYGDDPNLLQGPFDFEVYFKADDPCNMPLIDTILYHDTNEQVCVNVGTTLPGVTYYWRVDITDHNEPGDPCFYEGPVFSFTKWGYALYPFPEDGDTEVFPGTDPNWYNDGYAAEFDAFIGTNQDDVDASEEGALVGDTLGFYDIPAGDGGHEFDPGELLFGMTYYWRIDECNTPHGCVHGHLWSYTTSMCDPIDDFEDYTKSGGDNWI
ncbi:hypothetical protein ACFL1G_09115, partial [Planctomycetota bacterium]